MRYKESFLKYIQFEKRYSINTVQSYQNDLSQFYTFCEKSNDNFDILSVNDKIIRTWIVFLMENNASPKTVHRKISTLKSFFKFLIREKLLEKNPLDKVLTPKISKKLPSFIEKEQILSLLNSHDFGENFSGIRNKLIIEMFYHTGMRLSELINLKNTDVNTKELLVKVLGKRNKERIIPFSKELNRSVIIYNDLKSESFPDLESNDFFVTDKGKKIYEKLVYRIVNKYLQLVTTLEKKSPHILRHTFATHMLNSGADLNAIKELLGHSNLSATQIYTHNTFEKLKKIYKQAHPRA